jgi:DNA polymerase-3 subunit delta
MAKTDKSSKCVYVIKGNDDLLVNSRCDKLLDDLIAPEHRQMSLVNVDVDKADIADVLDELRTLPFLSDRRVVLIKKADKFISANRSALESYFENPSTTGILILTVSRWDLRNKLAKELPAIGKLISITAPTKAQLPRILVNYTRDEYSKTLEPNAARLLVELVGDNTVTLYNEIDKLALFADQDKTVNISHIESLVANNRIFNAFAVISAVSAGNTAEAVKKLRKMFTEDKATEYTVVGAFAYHFRKMFNARVMLDNRMHPSAIAKSLNIWYDKDEFFMLLKKLPLTRIAELIRKLADIDYQIKTGAANTKIAIEKLVLDLAAA